MVRGGVDNQGAVGKDLTKVRCFWGNYLFQMQLQGWAMVGTLDGGVEEAIGHPNIRPNLTSPLVLRRRKPNQLARLCPSCGGMHEQENKGGACKLWEQYFIRSPSKSPTYQRPRRGQGPRSTASGHGGPSALPTSLAGASDDSLPLINHSLLQIGDHQMS